MGENIINNLIENLIEEPLKSLNSFGTRQIRQIVQNRLLEYQVEEYNRNVTVKTILHRTKPVNLFSIYHPLNIFRIYENKYEKISTASVIDLFSDKQFLTIVGDAGSGKSMLLKYLFVQSTKEQFRFPIQVELRYLNGYDGDLDLFIKDRIFLYHKLGIDDNVISQLLNSGNFVFFLDGYDEIDSSIKFKATKLIDEFVKRYNKNYYLITSRPYNEIDLFPLFHNTKIETLYGDDVNQFVEKVMSLTQNEIKEKILISINKEENRPYRSFLSNPLLLSMFILSYQSYAEIPQRRSEFYRQVFDVLFQMHDSMSKMAYVREKVSGLSKDQFELLLETFSFLTFLNEKYYFSKDYIFYIFDKIKRNKPKLNFDNQKLLEDLLRAISIITKDGTNFTFPHISLQEYFAARYIADLGIQNKRRVYSKIKDKVLKSHGSGMFNFIWVLEEIDRKFACTELLLPVLDHIHLNLGIDRPEFEEFLEEPEGFKILTMDYFILDILLKEDTDYLNIRSKRGSLVQ